MNEPHTHNPYLQPQQPPPENTKPVDRNQPINLNLPTPPQEQPPAYHPPPTIENKPAKNGMITGLLSILGLFIYPPAGAILGFLSIGFSHKGYKEYKQTNTGQTQAIIGLITGYISIAYSLYITSLVIKTITEYIIYQNTH